MEGVRSRVSKTYAERVATEHEIAETMDETEEALLAMQEITVASDDAEEARRCTAELKGVPGPRRATIAPPQGVPSGETAEWDGSER